MKNKKEKLKAILKKKLLLTVMGCTFAFYYIVLTVLRGRLMYAILTKRGNDWKRYRNTVWILLLFTIVIVGMSILMQNQLESVKYPRYLIFAGCM